MKVITVCNQANRTWEEIDYGEQIDARAGVADDRVRDGGPKPKMQAIGACMRKLVMICYGVLKNRTPFDPNRASKIAT